MNILFRDNDIVVCFKEAGILSQYDGSKANMITLLSEETGSEVFPVHRLDRETAGVMVYALNGKAAADLSAQMTEKTFEKKYYAVIKGSPEEKNGIMEDLLFRDKQKNKTFTVKRMRKGIRPAKLEYGILCEREGLALADIKLYTGRTHQIRVQFSSRKMPLYGDSRYGGGSGELALCAYSIAFNHPTTKEKISFTQNPDTDIFPWSLFSEII